MRNNNDWSRNIIANFTEEDHKIAEQNIINITQKTWRDD